MPFEFKHHDIFAEKPNEPKTAATTCWSILKTFINGSKISLILSHCYHLVIDFLLIFYQFFLINFCCKQCSTIVKGYLRYKAITSQNVSLEAQVKKFFISPESYVPFSRYLSFCILNHLIIYQICDVMMSIST